VHVCNHCCDLCTSQEAQNRLSSSGLVPSTGATVGATGRGQKRAADNEAGSKKKKRSSKKRAPTPM
jgi:hypothetical protein